MTPTPTISISRMRPRLLLSAAFALFAAATAAGGTLTGVVRNGTTGKPAGGLDVILIQLQGGMQPVATTQSDAEGRYRFDRPELGAAPMLVRVPYRGVNYHQPVPPGSVTADVDVYEPTANPKTVTITQRAIVFQPKEGSLLVGEEFTIENTTKPPVAFYRTEGTFEFQLPEGAQLNQVSAWGATGMPLVQGTIDKGKGANAIAFPFRPGKNGVRLSYQMPYPSNRAMLHTLSPYAADRVLLVVPPNVQVLSAGFQPAGSQEGYEFYARDSIPARTAIDVSVSGAGGPSGASAAASEESPSQETGNSRTGGEVAGQAMPGRLEDLKWILVAGFAALFLLGVVFLWRKPQHQVPQNSKSGALVEADRAVKGSLDEIKENLFRLELRRQAGTMSEEEYARQRSRAEKILRDLVKG